MLCLKVIALYCVVFESQDVKVMPRAVFFVQVIGCESQCAMKCSGHRLSKSLPQVVFFVQVIGCESQCVMKCSGYRLSKSLPHAV